MLSTCGSGPACPRVPRLHRIAIAVFCLVLRGQVRNPDESGGGYRFFRLQQLRARRYDARSLVVQVCVFACVCACVFACACAEQLCARRWMRAPWSSRSLTVFKQARRGASSRPLVSSPLSCDSLSSYSRSPSLLLSLPLPPPAFSLSSLSLFSLSMPRSAVAALACRHARPLARASSITGAHHL